MKMGLMFSDQADFSNLLDPAPKAPFTEEELKFQSQIKKNATSKKKFTATTPSPEQIRVTKVVHRAYINVNEGGTEAAAATGKFYEITQNFEISLTEQFDFSTGFQLSYIRGLAFRQSIFNPIVHSSFFFALET